MASESELLERIRQLERENSILRDKLDLIYSIVADQHDLEPTEDDDDSDGLVQIGGVN